MQGVNTQSQIIEIEADKIEPICFTWKVDPAAPFLVSMSKPIFKQDSLAISPVNSVDTTTITADSSRDEAQQMSVSLGLEAEAPYYGATFSAAAETSLSSISNSKFKQFRSERYVKSGNSKLVFNTFDFASQLTDDANNFFCESIASHDPQRDGGFLRYLNDHGGTVPKDSRDGNDRN